VEGQRRFQEEAEFKPFVPTGNKGGSGRGASKGPKRASQRASSQRASDGSENGGASKRNKVPPQGSFSGGGGGQSQGRATENPPVKKDSRLTPMQIEMLIKQHDRAWAKLEAQGGQIGFNDVIWPTIPGEEEGKEGDLLRHMLRKDREGAKIRELRKRCHLT